MKVFALVLFVVLFPVYGKRSIRVGVVHYPPFFNFPSDSLKPDGKGITAMEKILAPTFNLIWVKVPMARGSFLLNENFIDVFTGYAKVPEVTRDLDYSDRPYMKITPQVCGTRNLDFKNFEDYLKRNPKKEIRLIYPNGSHVLPSLQLKNIKIIFFEYSDLYLKRGVKMLDKNRADYILTPYKIPTQNLGNLKCLILGDELGVRFTFKKGSSLKREVDELLKKAIAD